MGKKEKRSCHCHLLISGQTVSGFSGALIMEMKPDDLQLTVKADSSRKEDFVSRLALELQGIRWRDFSVGCVSHLSFGGGVGYPTSVSHF